MKIAGVIFSIIGIIVGIFMFFLPWIYGFLFDEEFKLLVENNGLIEFLFVVIENDKGFAFGIFLNLFLLAFTLLVGILGIIYSSNEHRSKGVYVFIIISGVLILMFIFSSAFLLDSDVSGYVSGYQGIFFIIVGILGIKNIKKMFKTCPFCGNLIKKEALICQFCGKDLPKYEEKALPKVEIVEKNEIIECKKCPFCGNEIKREVIVCQFCNKDVPAFIPTHKVRLLTYSDGMSLRKYPDAKLKPFTKLPNGTEIEYLETGYMARLVGKEAPWFKIISKDNICGWCFSGSLEKI